jgi:hypothetical protein
MNQAGRHLRFQALALAALLLGLLPAPFAATIADPVQLAGAFFGWAAAMYLFASGGTLVAALTFERGEPMRPGWLLLSASYLVLAAGSLRMGPDPSGLYQGAERSPPVAVLTSVGSGALAVIGFILLARAWRTSGLDGTTRRGRLTAQALALLVAGAMAGPDLIERLPAALGGNVSAAGDVLSDLLDGALFVVAVPVLRAALALGGGLVAWPWLLITASLAAWLGYDATETYGTVAGLEPRAVRLIEEVLRTVGAASAFTAGIAQRWVMTDRARGDRAGG